MKRTTAPAALVVAAAALCGARPADAGGFLLFWGIAIALLVLLGLPIGLLLHAWRREWIAAPSRAIERRTTACVLVGAGLAIATIFVVRVLFGRAPALAWLASGAAWAWFFVGFAGCARRHGERLFGCDGTETGVRPLVIGWLARAGLLAVPVVWPLFCAWLVVTAMGAPLVALFDRPRPDGEPPPATT